MFDHYTLQQLADRLLAKQYSVAVAESVTAGLLQAALASADNATGFFQGGITTYNARQKFTHLQVDLKHALSNNCVSDLVAAQMALGVIKSFHTDWGIGITGYASPLPGHDMETLFAHFSIVFRGEVIENKKIFTHEKEPFKVQIEYVDTVLKSFKEQLVAVAASS
jgi:PncC family amidohydrolase